MLSSKNSSSGASTMIVVLLLAALLVGAVVCLVVAAMASAGASPRPAEAQPRAGGVQKSPSLENDEEGQKKVQLTASGKNNYRVRGDENPMVYKSVDSRPGFEGGPYTHRMECPEGYKATGGGFDLNNPGNGSPDENYWDIRDSYPYRGDTWIVRAHGYTTRLNKKLPTFTAYAACAPKELLSGFRYTWPKHGLVIPNETKTIWSKCDRDERVISGGFDLGGGVNLVRSERSREDELSWGSGAKLAHSGSGNGSMDAWAVCVSRGALEETRYLEATDTSTKRAVANTPKCPQGTYLLSGGAGVSDEANARWSNSSPPHEGAQSWKASAIPRGLVYIKAIKVHAFALCGRFADDGGGGQGAGGASGDGGGDGGSDGSAFAQLGSVIQCDDELPCDATANHDVLSERAGDGAKDTMIAQGGYDLLQAQSNTNDPDVANGGSGHDVLLVNDGDAKDEAIGGAGTDVCVVDAAKEASGSCEAVIDR